MADGLRNTGIQVIGDVPWGTHFCQFYQTKEDLIEVLVPYFKAGLENNEFCMWITAEPLGAEEAKASLKKAVPNLDDFVRKGQIQILDAEQWYAKTGRFDADRVLQGWVEKENQAIKKGFAGLRLAGNTFWLEKADWRDFTDYEEQVNKIIGKHRILALCGYSLDKCGASEIIDVVQNHQFALIRRAGEWELIQSSERMMAEEALKAEKEFTETALNAQTDTFFVFEPLTGKAVRWNKAFNKITGYSDEEIRSMKAPDSYYSEEHLKKAAAATKKVLHDGIATVELSLITKDGRSIPTEYTGSVIKDYEGNPKYIIAVGRDMTERKRAEEALAETNKLLQTLLDHTHMMVAYLDPQFNFVKVNQAYAAADGREPSFFPGKNHFDLYPDAENEQIFQRVAKTGEPYFAQARPFEYAEHPERGITYWDWSLIPIKGPMGAVTGLVLTLVNVTERERAEQALRESEERLRSFMDSATDAFVLWDKELNLVEFNEAALKTFAPGTKKTEVIGKNILELVPALKKTGRYEAYLEVIRTANPFCVDDVISDPKFGERRVAITAFKVGDGFGMVITDITERKLTEEALRKARDELEIRVQERTRELSAANIELQQEIAERKQAEESLRASREEYRTLVETSRDMIFTVDLKGAFVFTNRAFEEILGYNPKEMSKINGFELIHPEDAENVGKQFARLVQGESVDNMEYRYRRKDGSYISILNNASPIFDADGNVVAAFGVARDITERKRAEQELTEYRDHLQELVQERTAELRKANQQLEKEIAERKQAEEGLEWELAVNRELAELSQALIGASPSIPEIADIVLDSAKSLTRSEHGYVSSIDPRTGDNVGHTLTKMMGDQCLMSSEYKRIVFPAGPDGRYPGLWGHALTAQRGFLTNSPATHETSTGIPEGHIPLKNFLSVPAMIGEELLGQIALANSAGDYTDRHLGAVKRLAEMYALAIQRGRAEEGLRESEERFRSVAQTASDAIITIDSTGSIVFWNLAAEAMFGYSPDEAMRKPLTFIMPERFHEAQKRGMKRVVSGGEAKVIGKTVEMAGLRKDRSEFPLELSIATWKTGDEIFFTGILRDITERKRAEEELRKRTYDLNKRVKELNSLYNMARLIETPGVSLEGIFQGTVDLIPAACEYPEITCARLVLGDRIFATSDFTQTRWKLASDVTVRGDREGSLEVYYLEERPERDEGPFLEEERSLLKTIVERLGRVIERKRAEEEIQKLNRSLEIQAAQLAAANKELEAFSYSVSHDLRAPLRTADGFSRALMEDYPDKLDERGKDYLRRIRAATQRMGQLIDDLLNLSMMMRKQMRRQETNLSKMARSIAAELRKSQPERQVEFIIQDGVLAHGDASLLREVLENLLRNSWKFTSKQAQSRIEFGETRKGGERVYFVRDDGVGFDMKYAEKLFVPFQRLHSTDEFPGNGVGLALASRILDRHGGRVWAEGEVEKGATFYFTLP